MNRLPYTVRRELETISALLLTANAEDRDIENDENATRQIREYAANSRATTKAAHIIVKNLLSRDDDILIDDGNEQETTAEGRKARPA